MKVKLIKWANIQNHCKHDLVMQKAFSDFYEKIKFADWEKPQDVHKTFNSVDLVNCPSKSLKRLVFNVGGNKYRLICGYFVSSKSFNLYVRFVGTHNEYDEIKVCEADMF